MVKDRNQQVQVDMPIGLVVNNTDLIVNIAKGLGVGRIVTPVITEGV